MKKEILVVDAQGARRDRLTADLQAVGNTRSTASALDALRLLDERRADFVITAIRFGRADIHGLALGHMIKNRWPDVEVLTLVEDNEDIGLDWDLPGDAIAVSANRRLDLDVLTRGEDHTTHSVDWDITEELIALTEDSLPDIELPALVEHNVGIGTERNIFGDALALSANTSADIEIPALVEDNANVELERNVLGDALAVSAARANVAYLPQRPLVLEDPMILKARELLKMAS